MKLKEGENSMIYFLDTSAILNGAINEYEKIYISPLSMQELENIKTSQRDDHTKYLAREAVREILFSNKINFTYINEKAIKKIYRQNPFLLNINDHHILAEALELAYSHIEPVHFVTSDGAQKIYADYFAHKINPIYYTKETEPQELYCGWGKYYPTSEQMAILYSMPERNILDAKINEYCEIFEGSELKDILRWDGTRYRNLCYHDIYNKFLGETIRPRNLEQKMAFDLLQNQNIKVKLLTSAWGGGKTLISLNYALEQISKGNYAKLIFVRNNIIAAGTNDIGFLPGTVQEKLSIFSQCIADHVGGPEELDRLMADNIIETIPLSHIRGRSLKDSIVLCDECENMDDKLVTLLMSRIEENIELIFCGDVAQIDKPQFVTHNGIKSMLKNLSGNELFGTVKLIKSERGPVPRLCDLLIPPK